MRLGKVLILLGWFAGITLIAIPLANIFGSNWPLAIIGEERWSILDTWTNHLPLLISGSIVFILLTRIGEYLKQKEAHND